MNLHQKFKQEGLRFTRPRKVVMTILESAMAPLSPQTIHQRSIAANKPIGLVSIYRTLNLLLELDLVRRVHSQDGCHGYVLATPGHHHHLVCQTCGKAVEFTGEHEITNIVMKIEQQTGFIIEGHLLQLFGICPQCQENRDHASKP